MNKIIGKHVAYKEGPDSKEYIVMDYVKSKKDDIEEVCILADFAYWHPGAKRTVQIEIWANLNDFTIVPDEA